jgi:hypothetical protein
MTTITSYAADKIALLIVDPYKGMHAAKRSPTE